MSVALASGGSFVKIIGAQQNLKRAIGYKAEALASFVAMRRGKKVALKFLRKAVRKHEKSGLRVIN